MDARCEETREMAAELALGIVEGEERGRALQHLAECPDCRCRGREVLRSRRRAAAACPAPRAPGGLRVAGAGRAAPGAAAQAPPRRLRLVLAPRRRGARGRGDHPRRRRSRPAARLALPAHPATRRTARSSSPTLCDRGGGRACRHRVQLRGIAVVGAHRRGSGPSLGLTSAELVTDDGSQVPLRWFQPRPGRGLGRLDPGRSEPRLGAAPLRRPGSQPLVAKFN